MLATDVLLGKDEYGSGWIADHRKETNAAAGSTEA
jgi:hypothetical protein